MFIQRFIYLLICWSEYHFRIHRKVLLYVILAVVLLTSAAFSRIAFSDTCYRMIRRGRHVTTSRTKDMHK
jgi:hypothetical protein